MRRLMCLIDTDTMGPLRLCRFADLSSMRVSTFRDEVNANRRYLLCALQQNVNSRSACLSHQAGRADPFGESQLDQGWGRAQTSFAVAVPAVETPPA